MQTSSSSFTVEQVELIRRIRNSGITCQQIIEAFQALDRIDAELGPIYSMPVSSALASKNGPQSSVRHQPTVSLGSGERTSASVITPNLATSNSVRNCSPLSVSANSPAYRSTPLTVPGATGQAGVTPLLGNVTAGRGINKFSDTLRDVAQAAMGKAGGPGQTYPGFPSVSTADMALPERPAVKLDMQAGNNGNATSSSGLSGHADNMKIEPSELTFDKCYNILLSQSQETLNMLVQKFLMLVPDNNLHKQSVDLGVSEAAMGQFMGGDWTSLDAGIRHKLLEWFISQLRHTDWFLDDLTQLLRVQGTEYNTEGLDVHFVPRRERFTFKEKHLEVLEVFFKKGQYPTQEEKEHIANECNIAMAMETDRELLDREKMTHVNVTNWFSNRRKEIKRLAKKGGIETERVILPSRVKTKNPAHHLPTYDELAEEQLAKQKTLGLTPGFLNFGGSHTSFSWKTEQDAGHSLDGSNFSNITNTNNHQNYSSMSSSSQDGSLLHGPNNHHDISNHLGIPPNHLDTSQNHLETLQNQPHPGVSTQGDASIVFPSGSIALGVGAPKTSQSVDHPNPFTTVSGVNVKLEPADT